MFINHFIVTLQLPNVEDEENLPYIADGGLPNVYYFSQLHFHWGSDTQRGSEHQLSSKA